MTDLLKQVVIVGGGPAGLSAALWADDLGLDAILFESSSEIGGQLRYTYNPITNYLGQTAENGSELRERFAEHLTEKSVKIVTGTRIVALESASLLLENGQRIGFEYLVLATGVSRRNLNVPGEAEFRGNGILHSGKRDAARAAGQTAVVIGGGDAAFENALLLSEHATKVCIVHRSKDFKARNEFVDNSLIKQNIKILSGFEVTAFEGSDRLEKISLRDVSNGSESQLEVETAVIRIGVKPNTELVKDNVSMKNTGYIKIDNECMTSEPSIYAIGDVANQVAPTINSAAGMGATAIKSIARKIQNLKNEEL